jgi:acetylglutamate kinase
LSLADAGLTEVTQLDPELGHVGKAQPGDASAVQALLSLGITPIISSIGITADGELMNVNADQAAVAIAGAVDGDLVLLSDVSGVLDGKGHLIPALNSEQANALIDGKVITEGMIVKVLAALDAAQELGRPIQVASWRYVDKLNALLAGESVGTQFLPQAD